MEQTLRDYARSFDSVQALWAGQVWEKAGKSEITVECLKAVRKQCIVALLEKFPNIDSIRINSITDPGAIALDWNVVSKAVFDLDDYGTVWTWIVSKVVKLFVSEQDIISWAYGPELLPKMNKEEKWLLSEAICVVSLLAHEGCPTPGNPWRV